MSRTAVLWLLPLLASPAVGATLCRHGETDGFWCTLRDGRQVSVCGQVDTDGRHDAVAPGEWMQLRMGRPGALALALAWLATRAGSTEAFPGNVFVRCDVSFMALNRTLHRRRPRSDLLDHWPPAASTVTPPAATVAPPPPRPGAH